MSLNEGLALLRGRGEPAAATPAPQPAAPPQPGEDGAPQERKPSARQRKADLAAGVEPAEPQLPRRTPPTRAQAQQPAAATSADPFDAIVNAFRPNGAAEPAPQPQAPTNGQAAPPMQAAPTNAYLQPVPVVIDGREHSFSHEQLSDYVRKGIDYTTKTQALAETVRQIDERQRTIAELLPIIVPEIERQLAALDGGGPETPPDWATLSVTDPAEYVRQDAQWKAREATRNAERKRLEMLRAENERVQTAQRADKMRSSHLELIKSVPGWNDAPTRQKIQTEMMAWGKKEGFPAEELSSIVEARHVRTMLKAMLFDRMVAGAASRAPVVPQVAAGSPPPPPAPGRTRAAEERFQQRPNVNNAVQMIMARRAAAARQSAG